MDKTMIQAVQRYDVEKYQIYVEIPGKGQEKRQYRSVAMLALF